MDRDPGNLYSMEHIGTIAQLAKKLTDEVFGHLVTGPALIADRPGVLDIYRNWPGRALPLTQDVWVQVFRAHDSVENQRQLWSIFQVLLHENLHLLTHFLSYVDQLGFGAHAYNTLL